MGQRNIYQEQVIMARRTVNEFWNGWSLHNKTITVLQHYKIKAQSINFITSVIWWKMCRRSNDCHTIGQSYNNNGMKLNGLAFRIASWRHVVWHKEELMQKKIVYVFIKQVSSMWSKNQVFCPYAIYTHTHTLTS